MTNHSNIMKSLTKRYDPLIKIINRNPVYYLDIPIHGNIGDLLIMKGTLCFFTKNNIILKKTSSALDYDFPNIPSNTVILLHGGGNLGDLYNLHQDFRAEIIKKYPLNTIVILPQTIFFESVDNYKKCCDLYSKHPNLHICVRDSTSQELAQNMSPNVYLMPDMAHHLYPIFPLNPPQKSLLFLKRTDIEANNDGFIKTAADTTIDWDVLIGSKRQYIIKKFFKILKFSKKHKMTWLSKITISIWLKYSNYLINKAIQLFSDHHNVITNRLHAHILSSLMDKQHQVFDNSYGKNSAYIQQWTRTSELTDLQYKNPPKSF